MTACGGVCSGYAAAMWLVPMSLAIVAAAPATDAPLAERWEQARGSMEQLDFKAALHVLEELVEVPHLQPGMRAELMVALAVTWFNLNRPDKAETALESAFAWDPAVTLPQRFATPRLQQLFEQKRPAPASPAAEGQASDVSASVAQAPQPAPAAAPMDVQGAPRQAAVRRSWAPLAGSVGVGAVALVTGIVLAGGSQARAEAMGASPHNRAEVDRLERERQGLATASVVAYGVAGAAAVAAVVFAVRDADRAALAISPWAAPQSAGLVLILVLE